MKNIIVVSDDKRFGRELVFNISKNPEIKAALYTARQYIDNESQLSGNNYVIFFEINSVSEDFVKLIIPKHSEDNVFWGYEGTKAIIYTKNWESLPYSIPVCISLLRKLISINKNLIYQLDDLKYLSDGNKIIKMVTNKKLDRITRDFVERNKWILILFSAVTHNEIFKLSQTAPLSIIKKKYAVHSFLKNGFEDFIK